MSESDNQEVEGITEEVAAPDGLMAAAALEADKVEDEGQTIEHRADAEVEDQPSEEETFERPDFIPEKFWDATKGEVNLEEFGKSYTNLEKYVGGKKEELRDQIVDELQQEAIAERPEKVEGYELPKLPEGITCLLYTSPSPRDLSTSRMPSSA